MHLDLGSGLVPPEEKKEPEKVPDTERNDEQIIEGGLALASSKTTLPMNLETERDRDCDCQTPTKND